MRKTALVFIILAILFCVLMSLPWLVPHCGVLALVGLVPLLVMERLATKLKTKHFWWWHYGTFVVWNAITTWWVANATVGGAIFAILANALQMSLVFGAFRWVKRRLGGVLPYIFLAAAWIAWEKYYLTVAEISWPWLVLGNAFAETTSLVQWYSVTGHLGGSLWVWCANLSVFGIMVALSDGRMAQWGSKARAAAIAGVAVAFFGPMLWSVFCRPKAPQAWAEVVIGQPNFDPYHKFQSLTQEQQDRIFLDLVEPHVPEGRPSLILAPETFTSRFSLDDIPSNASFRRYQEFLKRHPDASMLFGVSGYNQTVSYAAPSLLCYDLGEAGNGRHLWYTSRNSAVLTDTSGRGEVFHKSKLVVGTELTPYPKVFVPLERLFGGNLMGKCQGQKEPTCLHWGSIPLGVAVCYESVYGEYCAKYVRKGAEFLAVITNDAWWGNTPGYRQHFSYSRLRAIETRRYVARCANTGISAIIDPSGRYLSETPWWQQAVTYGHIGLSRELTPFVRWGDITGRVAVFLFALLSVAAVFRRREKHGI
ncbi:MAG: apolipoprotein N-acyltransferase [Bacteroidales bacterium]|nr:apolipoprotein N-acyltransferase [Bacteroidales bacterium]